MEFQKENVYTALNADEVKVGSKGYFADKLETLRAFVSENEVPRTLVEVLGEEYERRFDEGGNPWNLFYLVEEPEEETYRPYETTDEMIEDFKERAKAYGANFFKCPMFNPTIWVKDKKSNSKYLISAFGETNVYLSSIDEYSLELLFEDFTYLDGSPCGKKIVE